LLPKGHGRQSKATNSNRKRYYGLSPAQKSGGLGPAFEWTTQIELVEEITQKTPGSGHGKKNGKKGPGTGDLVALIWKTEQEVENWSPKTVGTIEGVPGSILAELDAYKDLANIEAEIPTIMLNRTYSPLKTYIAARAGEVGEVARENALERYAVGVGVALLILDQHAKKLRKQQKTLDEDTQTAAAEAAARSVLSVLPEYDRLAQEMED